MFIAELSAVNLGDFVYIRGVKRGNKYDTIEAGILTEVKHNTADGYTTVRLAWGQTPNEIRRANPYTEHTDNETVPVGTEQIEAVRFALTHKLGAAASFPFGQEITRILRPVE